MKRIKESAVKFLFFMAASASVFAVVLICIFLFANGLPAVFEIGPVDFLFGTVWKPTNGIFGILPMILGSFYVTVGAAVLGVPVGILAAVGMAKYCPKGIYRLLSPAVGIMAGIPSIIYGFFGLVVIVPFVREHFGAGAVSGNSILTASLILGIMILPTVIGVCESAIRAVPESYYEGALALGATKERSIFFAVLPAARSGIWAGVILGVGRALGETMAVMMVAGNQARIPSGILSGARTLTANIAIEIGYATDLHREALIATGVVLFIFLMLFNFALSFLKRRMK